LKLQHIKLELQELLAAGTALLARLALLAFSAGRASRVWVCAGMPLVPGLGRL
jgi:hypothetical protein